MTAGTQADWRPSGPEALETAGAAQPRRAVQWPTSARVDLSGVPQADSAELAVLLDLVQEPPGATVIDLVGMPAGLRSLADLYVA
ncbi:MAG: STAS domain-containing protein [Rhodocyclaceae bacterium]